MKILCICDQGNNRSVTFAHLLKYWGNDTLSAGLSTTSEATLKMLCTWADRIVVTEAKQFDTLYDIINPGDILDGKLVVCDVGPDTYPRPFNKDLLAKAKQQLELHRAELHNADEGSKVQEQYRRVTHPKYDGLHPFRPGCSCAACTSKYEQSITR